MSTITKHKAGSLNSVEAGGDLKIEEISEVLEAVLGDDTFFVEVAGHFQGADEPLRLKTFAP